MRHGRLSPRTLGTLVLLALFALAVVCSIALIFRPEQLSFLFPVIIVLSLAFGVLLMHAGAGPIYRRTLVLLTIGFSAMFLADIVWAMSKVSGTYQLYAVAFNKYPTPIPTPDGCTYMTPEVLAEGNPLGNGVTVSAAALAQSLGRIGPDIVARQKQLLLAFDLPVTAPTGAAAPEAGADIARLPVREKCAAALVRVEAVILVKLAAALVLRLHEEHQHLARAHRARPRRRRRRSDARSPARGTRRAGCTRDPRAFPRARAPRSRPGSCARCRAARRHPRSPSRLRPP